VFLGLTALREFWNTREPILFLGSWCLPPGRGAPEPPHQVMPSPWDNRQRYYDAARYLDEYVERLLGDLTDYLNAAHEVKHSRRYWRILLGPWLIHVAHVVYDRYVHLVQALNRTGEEPRTILLDQRSFRTPRDTLEFIDLICGDPYNHQIFSEILTALGLRFPTRELEAWPSRSFVPAVRQRRRDDAYGRILRVGHRVLGSVRRSGRPCSGVALFDLDGTNRQTYRLAWATRLLAVPWRAAPRWTFSLGDLRVEKQRRELALLPSANEFERILIGLLPRHLPTLYLEHYHAARSDTLRRVSTLPHVLVSANGWLGHEPFKFLAAEAAARGRRLVAAQHGGGYGVCRAIPLETHEARVADTFLVWGWADPGTPGLANVPSIKLSAARHPHLSRLRPAILFVANAYPRYLYRFQSTPMGSHLEEYFEWQGRFLAALSEERRSSVLFRGHAADFGNDVRGRVALGFPEVSHDDGTPFRRRLRHCRMVVIDNLSTTLLEALVADVPTILFWDPSRWEVRDEAEDAFGGLRTAGILWDSPEAAAGTLETVYGDPRAWWRRGDVQAARRKLVERYALAQRNWAASWSGVLDEQAALAG